MFFLPGLLSRPDHYPSVRYWTAPFASTTIEIAEFDALVVQLFK